MFDEDSQYKKEDAYNGNSKLKKAGVETQFSEWELDELEKCQNDVHYFIANYCMIISLDDGLVPFRMFGYQKKMVDIVLANRFSIFKWPRQMGKTTVVAAILLWYAIFNEEYRIAILANKGDQSREILARLQLMYEELPWFMQVGVSVWNKGNIKLGNRSEVFTAATGGSSIRGKSVNLMYLDEFAFVENDVDFYTSTYPVVTSGTKTKVIITSTPNGMNLFYKIWTDSTNGKNNYVNNEAFWHDHPKRDQAWKEEQLRNMSERQFEQEFLCKFQGSSDTLLSPAKLEQLTYQDHIRELGGNRDFKIYEDPIKDASYVVTVDVAEGIGKDYSVISVFDTTEAPFRQVAMLRSNIIAPLILADLANRIGHLYNQAVLIVECNSIGNTVVTALWEDYEYENLLMTKNKEAESKVGEGGKSQPGVRTTKKTKLIGCSQLKMLIESDQLIIQDFDTVAELNSFIKKGTSWEAEQGKTDDIVMTLVIFAWFASQPYFAEMVDQNIRNLVRANLMNQDEYSSAFGFLDDGWDDESVTDNGGLF